MASKDHWKILNRSNKIKPLDRYTIILDVPMTNVIQAGNYAQVIMVKFKDGASTGHSFIVEEREGKIISFQERVFLAAQRLAPDVVGLHQIEALAEVMSAVLRVRENEALNDQKYVQYMDVRYADYDCPLNYLIRRYPDDEGEYKRPSLQALKEGLQKMYYTGDGHSREFMNQLDSAMDVLSAKVISLYSMGKLPFMRICLPLMLDEEFRSVYGKPDNGLFEIGPPKIFGIDDIHTVRYIGNFCRVNSSEYFPTIYFSTKDQVSTFAEMSGFNELGMVTIDLGININQALMKNFSLITHDPMDEDSILYTITRELGETNGLWRKNFLIVQGHNPSNAFIVELKSTTTDALKRLIFKLIFSNEEGSVMCRLIEYLRLTMRDRAKLRNTVIGFCGVPWNAMRLFNYVKDVIPIDILNIVKNRVLYMYATTDNRYFNGIELSGDDGVSEDAFDKFIGTIVEPSTVEIEDRALGTPLLAFS